MKKILVFVLTLAFAVACSKDHSSPLDLNPVDKTDVLIPLAVGNTWYYDTYFVSSSNPKDSIKIESSFATVPSKFKIGDEDWYNWSDGTDGWAPLTNRDDGLYFYVGEEYPPLPFYKYPTKVGDKNAEGSSKWKTISVDAQISVPAGKFSCIQFEQFNSGPLKSYDFYCPKVGLIQESHIVEITGKGAFLDTTWSHTVLTKYVLK
ncbi:MAG: hypothetical protein ACM3U1_07395 [Chloroflexota bacterium]